MANGATQGNNQERARALPRYPWMAVLALSLQACGASYPANEVVMQGEGHDVPIQAHWSYMGIAGPDHWAMLTQAYQACESGARQSPINIEMSHPMLGSETIEFRYATSRLFEVNNGHTIQVSHASGCAVGLGEDVYQLRQFHFHAPGEHQIHGKAFPMEMHLVHQDLQGRILVIAVLLENGSETPVLKTLWQWLPEQVGREVSLPLELNLAAILPPHPHYFAYSGSLTTPPCTEGVRWVVLEEPVQVAEEDVRRFVEIIGSNARPVQPLKGREVVEH